jgi:integrase
MAKPKRQGHWETEPLWDAGRVWVSATGERTYFIRKQVGGTRYDRSTHATTIKGAMEQLKRFEAEPGGYDPRGVVRAAPIFLDEVLVRDFIDWSRDVRKNSHGWVVNQKQHLGWWSEQLEGVDLRRASLRDHIMPALDHAASRPQRIAVIKTLYAWLRKERRVIATAEDPTFGTLAVPQGKPEQLDHSKAVSKENFHKALEKLPGQRERDLLLLLGATGMHVSELVRFSADGSVESLPGRKDAAGAVVIPSTKAGDPLRVAVSTEMLEAAKRVLKTGSFDRQRLAKLLKKACKKGRVKPAFTLGVLRHSVATWAVNAGADVKAVSDFLGHRSPRTTRRFYATLATPKKVPTLA